MKIYHGSIIVIEKPIYGYGKKHNDYGLAFYCTESLDLAKEWAVGNELDGYANCYELNLDGLNVINLNKEPYTILNWLAILLENRVFKSLSPLAEEAKQFIIDHYSIDYKNVDVIIGYRADDSYFSFARDFIQGAISYRQLNLAMHLGNLGEQVALVSEKAFDAIKFVGSEKAFAKEWYQKKQNREIRARKDYFDRTKMFRQKGDIYISQIIDEEMEANDERLQRNVS